MKCPTCGQELRPGKKDPSYMLCDHCHKKYKITPDTVQKDEPEKQNTKNTGHAAGKPSSGRPPVRKNTAQKNTAKKSTAKKSTVPENTSRKNTGKKPPVKQQTVKQQTVKKTPVRKPEVQDMPVKKKKKKSILPKIILAVIILAVIAILAKTITDSLADRKKHASGNSVASQTQNNTDTITNDMYSQIEMGMTYEQVTKITGSNGQKISEEDSNGITTDMYQWKAGEGFGNVIVTVQNGAVTGKSQTGILKTNDAVMDLDKYDQIENGMSYDDVKNIIGGDGVLTTESLTADITAQTYTWFAEDGISNAAVSFQNGAVTSKSQVGLG